MWKWRETFFSPEVHNVATNWHNDGMVVSNISNSAVVTAIARDAQRRDAAPRNGDRHLVNNLQCREPSEECFRAGAIMAMIRIGVKNE